MGKFDRKLKNEKEIKEPKKVPREIFDRKNENSRNKRLLDNILATK